MKRNKTNRIWGVLIFIAVLAIGIAAVMLLWNALIPQIVGWTVINYWQAAGLVVLCRLLFGGFGKFGHGGRRGYFGGFGHRDIRQSHLFEKMDGMSRQERREYMKEHIRRFNSFDDRGDRGDRGGEQPSEQ